MEGVSGTVTRVVLSSAKESQKLEFDQEFLGDFRRNDKNQLDAVAKKGKTEGRPER